MSDKLIKMLDLDIKGRFDIAKRVYSPEGISPTLNSAIGQGGACHPSSLSSRDYEKSGSPQGSHRGR